jgi:hypothetical protein
MGAEEEDTPRAFLFELNRAGVLCCAVLELMLGGFWVRPGEEGRGEEAWAAEGRFA